MKELNEKCYFYTYVSKAFTEVSIFAKNLGISGKIPIEIEKRSLMESF